MRNSTNENLQGDTAETWIDHRATGFGGGSGTESNPYKISTPEQLAYLAYRVNNGIVYNGTYFKQTCNISLSGYTWVRIGYGGDAIHAFQGIYDGDNFIISDMYVNSSVNYQGLFGSIRGGVLKNIIVKNSTVMGIGEVGAIVGLSDTSSQVINCHSNAKIIGSGDMVGGISGNAWSSTIDNCSFTGSVQGSAIVAGIIGRMHYTTVLNCKNYGSVTALEASVGGIAGKIDDTSGRIENCISDGVIQGKYEIGSIIGIAEQNGAIKNCVGMGQLIQTGTGASGAIVGKYNGTLENCCFIGGCVIDFAPIISAESSSYTVTNCYSYFNQKGYYTSGTFTDFGLVSGINNGLPIQKSLYYMAEISNATSSQIISVFTSKNFTKI